MEVQVSGCVFASLFLELANSQGDVDGFLFGDISHRTTRTVSDAQDQGMKHQCIFAVQEIAVCPGLFSFYDGVGRIHAEKLAKVLGKKKPLVLGWFKFRRHARLGVSMREKVIHRNLLEQLEIQQPENFIFSVFTSDHATNMATHGFRYSAYYSHKHTRMFTTIPINPINLGNTAHDYKQDIAATRSTSRQYQNVIGSFRDEFLDNIGQLQQVKHARSMYTNMIGKLKGLKENVHASESRLESLSDNIADLKDQLERVIQEKRQKPEDGVSDDTSTCHDVDLISFEDLDTQETEGSQEPAQRHVVVAKRIERHNIQEDSDSILRNSSNTVRLRQQHVQYFDGSQSQEY